MVKHYKIKSIYFYQTLLYKFTLGINIMDVSLLDLGYKDKANNIINNVF